MAKIKVVQIALTPDGLIAEYLDDKGRVWQQNQTYTYPEGSDGKLEDRKLQTEWTLLDLPEEPAA